jgi:hypothetical protein
LSVALGCVVIATATSSLHKPTRHKGQPLDTRHDTRTAQGTAARRGGVPGPASETATQPLANERARTLRPGVATVSGSRRCGSTQRPSMRKRLRGALGACGSKARPQARTRKEDDARGDMAAGRLTSGWRCSRRRLDDVGGASSVFTAASCSGSASLLLQTASPSSGSSRPRRPPVAARRRRRGTQLAPPHLHFPGPFPLAAAHTRERGKPQRGLVGCDCDPGLPYRVSVKAVRGQKGQGASLLVAKACWPTWLHASGGQASFGVTGQGKKRAFP